MVRCAGPDYSIIGPKAKSGRTETFRRLRSIGEGAMGGWLGSGRSDAELAKLLRDQKRGTIYLTVFAFCSTFEV